MAEAPGETGEVVRMPESDQTDRCQGGQEVHRERLVQEVHRSTLACDSTGVEECRVQVSKPERDHLAHSLEALYP